MKKILLISLLLMAIANSAYAKENKATVTSEGVSASVPEEKTEAASPKKQGATKQEAVSLETAYKHEYAFLEAQKRELAERLKGYQSGANREEQSLSRKISALERGSV